MTNADKIRRMNDAELTDFLNRWAMSHVAWKEDPGETLCWLREEAETKASISTTEPTVPVGEFNVPEGTAIAFVDGSYNAGTKCCGWGVVLFDPNNPAFQRIEDCGQTEVGAEHRNVSGEVFGAMKAVRHAKVHGFKAVVIYHDYQGISSWANGEWKTNISLTREYARFIKEARADIDISFVKVAGHTGVELNERADILAKTGCGVI